jgi:hypothetical protein
MLSTIHPNGYTSAAKDSMADIQRRKGKVKLMITDPPTDMDPEKAPKPVPVAETQTHKMLTRVRELEQQAAQQAKAVEDARTKLSSVIAEGGDATSLRKTLAAAQDELGATVGALRHLDQKLVETSAAERAAAIDALRIDTENRYREMVDESRKAVTQMSDRVKKIIGPERAEQVSEELVSAMRNAAWGAANEKFDTDYLRFVPTVVKTAPNRDENGKVSAQPVHALGIVK